MARKIDTSVWGRPGEGIQMGPTKKKKKQSHTARYGEALKKALYWQNALPPGWRVFPRWVQGKDNTYQLEYVADKLDGSKKQQRHWHPKYVAMECETAEKIAEDTGPKKIAIEIENRPDAPTRYWVRGEAWDTPDEAVDYAKSLTPHGLKQVDVPHAVMREQRATEYKAFLHLQRQFPEGYKLSRRRIKGVWWYYLRRPQGGKQAKTDDFGKVRRRWLDYLREMKKEDAEAYIFSER